jgi:hypothetical protein
VARKQKLEFGVMPASEMRAMHGLTADNRPTILLDPSAVPPALRHLIPLAERFGISDDLIREDVVVQSPAADLAAMRSAVEAHNDAFDEWLAGPSADGPDFSPEYIAFTCLRMTADSV